MRWIVLIVAGIILSGPSSPRLEAQSKNAIRKVVIDAGHGGKDPGALGRRVQEKKITLAVAQRLGKLISADFPEIKVLYTREKDVFVELYERAGIANRSKADLFISIHCNANPSAKFRGAESYVMGLHRTDENLDIAKKENAAILLEPDYTKNYNGFDPNSDESYITFSLFQDIYLEQSTGFAAGIQRELKSGAGMTDRGVRQAGFLVLYKTTMPSVLVEIGFLSNPEEENFLMSEKGQDEIAQSIFRAFRKYRDDQEGTGRSTATVPPSAKEEKPAEKKKDAVVVPETKEKPAAVKSGEKSSVWFAVQVATSPTDIGTGSKRFAGLDGVRMYRHQGLCKYTTGRLSTVEEALALQAELMKKGYPDAFVVAFDGTERITVQQARQRMETGKK